MERFSTLKMEDGINLSWRNMNTLQVKFLKTCTLAVALNLFATPVFSQWSYPNCTNGSNADFTVTQLIGKFNDPDLLEPSKMDFFSDEQGNVDIYYVQRYGGVKWYDAKKKTVTNIGEIAVETGGEDGLVGLALDPLG